MVQGFKDMQKNPQENLTVVEIDPVSGEHYIVVPEWVCCLLYTSPSPRDATLSRMPSSA